MKRNKMNINLYFGATKSQGSGAKSWWKGAKTSTTCSVVSPTLSSSVISVTTSPINASEQFVFKWWVVWVSVSMAGKICLLYRHCQLPPPAWSGAEVVTWSREFNIFKLCQYRGKLCHSLIPANFTSLRFTKIFPFVYLEFEGKSLCHQRWKLK